jgi:uncharacterized protein YgiM (DUF1202 family)
LTNSIVQICNFRLFGRYNNELQINIHFNGFNHSYDGRRCARTGRSGLTPRWPKPAGVQYPFSAEVIGDDVYIRTGNSINDYHSGKVNKGFKVTVVDEVLGWAKILPPEGSYSWIAKSYVNVAAGATTGVVTGDSVRVWAGSDYREPIASPSLQTKLNAGEVVELMPNQPESSDYFKIKPPAGAHLWISAEFLKFVAPLQQDKPVVVPPRPDSVPAEQAIPVAPADANAPAATEQPRPVFKNIPGQEGQFTEESSDSNAPVVVPPAETAPTPAPAPKPVSKESLLLKENYKWSAKIEEISKKPLKEQDFTEVKQALEVIKADAEAGRAAAYAQILLERINRFELASSAIDEIQQQDQNLQQTREQIEKAHQAELAKLPKEADYLYTGKLKPSYVYSDKSGAKRYLLLDANGKIVTYLVAATPEVATRLDTLLDNRVGVKGTIANNAKSLVTLVNVTAVDSMPE